MPKKRKSAVQKKVECCWGNLDYWDWRFVKLSVAAAMLTLVSGIKSFGTWVMSVQWSWFFLAMVIFAIRPFKRAYCSKN